MKLRREIAKARSSLLREIAGKHGRGKHECKSFTEEGFGCMACMLEVARYPFALLHYFRTHKWSLSLFPSEIRLYTLLGEEQLKAAFKREVNLVRNFPKKQCPNCGHIICLWMPYSSAAAYLCGNDENRLRSVCAYCQAITYFYQEEIVFKFEKSKEKNTKIKRYLEARRMAERMGHESDEHEPNDFEDYEEEDNDGGEG